MIRGVVSQYKARISLKVLGVADRSLTIEAAVDTGFNGMLTLPHDVIAALELQWKSESCGVLADGRVSYFDVYEATVLWHGRKHNITVNELDMYPAVGMGLLDGSELSVKVRPGGRVVIKPLRRSR